MKRQQNSEDSYFQIKEIKEIGEGMRVCIDFVDILKPEEGLYVGNTGHGYIRVLSENRKSEGYPARPFRLNAGSFHQYLHQPDKTRYLAELNPGEELVVTDGTGSRTISVGRVKIEKRPLLRVVCEKDGHIISATVQKSSSVWMAEKEKGQFPLQELKEGDFVACFPDTPGRHLGEKIEETIIEN